MAAPVPLQWRLPEEAEIAPRRPVLGRTLMALAGALNHVNGLHARGWLPVACYQLEAESLTALDVGMVVGERENEVHRIPFFIPSGCDLFRVAVVGLAFESGGAAEPAVAVSVYDTAGVAVDTGFDLTREGGTLPGDERNVRGEYWLWPFVGEVGARTLSLAGKAGNVAILRLDTTRCLLVAAFLMPELAAAL